MEHETGIAQAREQAKPLCSIVIPVYNKASLTRQCLYTLVTQPPEQVDAEIIVVDDASTDATPILLSGYGGRIGVVTHAVNTGFAGACNDGARAASGEYLVFLNNDTIPQPGWLDALARHAEQHPQAGIIGSKLLYPNETIQHAGVAIRQDRFPWHIYRGFPADHPAVNRSRRFQAVTGACMLVRREVFEQARGFDTAYVNNYEDVDLCLRAGELGHEVHYCHESVLYHLESVSRDPHSQDGVRSWRVFSERWSRRLVPDDVQYYLADGLLTLGYELNLTRFRVSPLLGVVEGDEQGQRLADCTRQVTDLLNENLRLKLAIEETAFSRTSRDGSDRRLPGQADPDTTA